MALQLIDSNEWELTLGDVEAAFLRGDAINRKRGRVLVKVPSTGIPGVGQRH